jgi:hypothetical protein
MIDKELNTIQLLKILSSDSCTKHLFRGVYAINRLPKNVMYPSVIVVNTDTSDGPGMHWLCIIYSKNKSAFLYCPLGMHPKIYGLATYLNSTSIRWNYNKCQHQSLNSNLCGYFVFLFIIFKCRGINVKLTDRIINKFLTSPPMPP